MRQKSQPRSNFSKGTATMRGLNRETVHCAVFLFIKKSARKHEGKKNIEESFGQREGSVKP